MGNCHASDAVAAVVEYPGGRIEKIYWSVTARQLMLQNPGHYVGMFVWPKASPSSGSQSFKPKLKLLPPAAMLSIGKCYRLVTYEEVIGDLTEGKGNIKIPKDAIKQSIAASKVTPESTRTFKFSNVLLQPQQAAPAAATDLKPLNSRPGQWRPSLYSISEMGGS
ncbi:uncharacterized protein LOC9654600 isoform X3 [Selaginella moellendorffii]|uniref:uncharacterized protein LOC9643105 isoform X3 n=1 Tax=Selaginella moellendorffii TaxID=88036 RepID=UPI000D1C7723|nr:uncharacterized protein LOC9643105 isoform X3 [Selaginella moellendorffii]XP_024544076.1 uncharacterized protein LOC9654600 isoform X3 [Selaginella moellendorffii]|eukprot:XP_024524694.1 uncharacterized protein LOC9643105 isoform X3 [Selaginella moellendorffii]